jgi:hypothetical protein
MSLTLFRRGRGGDTSLVNTVHRFDGPTERKATMATLWTLIALTGFIVFAAFSMWLLLVVTIRVWSRPTRRGSRARKSKAAHNPSLPADHHIAGRPF